jgi:hypothetical protein
MLFREIISKGRAKCFATQDSGLDSQQGQEVPRFTQPPSHVAPHAFSQGIKWPERGNDHSPILINDIRNTWSYTSIPPYILIVYCLIKHRHIMRIIPALPIVRICGVQTRC